MTLTGYKRLNKQELIHKILDHQAVVGAASNSDEPKPVKKRAAAKPRAKATTAKKAPAKAIKTAKVEEKPEVTEEKRAPARNTSRSTDNTEEERANRRARAVRNRGQERTPN